MIQDLIVFSCYVFTIVMRLLIVRSFPSKALQDGTQSATFKIYVFVISAYAGVKIIMSLLMSVPCCHGLTEACYRWSAVRLVKWMHQVLSFLAFLGSCSFEFFVYYIFCLGYLTFYFCWRRTIMLEEACMRVPLTISSNPLELSS